MPHPLETLAAALVCTLFIIGVSVAAIVARPEPAAICTTDIECEQLHGEPVNLQPEEH